MKKLILLLLLFPVLSCSKQKAPDCSSEDTLGSVKQIATETFMRAGYSKKNDRTRNEI